MALASLTNLHHRFERDLQIAKAYKEFMETYANLEHMMRIPATEIEDPSAWYLPHHAVIQSSPTNWKLRVVFDASRRTHEKFCLNNFLLSGPALQKDLSLILLNWRRYRFVFTADIVKMFRQIRVASINQDFQRIVWAPSPRETPVDYRLTTVTYGTTCAPYLAIRTLLQLADDEKVRFPLGARCLSLNTYVDDTFAGSNHLSRAIQKRIELEQILKLAGMELNKWAANHVDLLPADVLKGGGGTVKEIEMDSTVKLLGINWDPERDIFSFNLSRAIESCGALTKRSIFSGISRLFDPLGWLSPVTVTAKILMQDLWILKYEWDSPLPPEIRDRWLKYCDSLVSLPKLSIDRWLGVLNADISCQLHGFADASSRAYAAVIYLRVKKGDTNFEVSLLAAKTKVAPVRTVSIPNLELCGAVLLVKLMNHVRKLDFFRNLELYMWSDSQIVLKWLSKHACSWKTFIANRVSFIQTELPSAVWLHISTKENPADIATRGLNPVDLKCSSLWWRGPSWLTLQKENWPRPLEKTRVLHAQCATSEPEILTRFSSLTRLIRVVSYCLRPLVNLRRRKSGLSPLTTALTAAELAQAGAVVIRLAQMHAFGQEIKLIENGKSLAKRHQLLKLNPILSKNDGILRVGGLLRQSSLAREQKHPPILPRCSTLSRLFVEHAHRLALHGGPTLASSVLMQRVWILGRKKLVNSIIHKCAKCQRVKPHLAKQLMGDLPKARVTPARPFTTTGLDYAGPFYIRMSKGRGNRKYKGYIALFICFVTRAIHLKLVSDLTTASFILAYRRFVSRRGICKNLYSDNATTFKGADSELKAMFKSASKFYQETAEVLANDGTSWTFIPPTTPHYGGLWEAGVKSTKFHLKRAFGDLSLTFEEFTTVLTEIESCLNSRPLNPLSSDIDDLQALTPAHFLIGATSALIPDEEPPSGPVERLKRYHMLQRIRNQFWRQWSKEYLCYLQERSKWRSPSENFKIGYLVLLRDDRYPPTKWPLGRIIDVHPGSDGVVRVVTIKTATGVFQRHIARVCVLETPSTATEELKI